MYTPVKKISVRVYTHTFNCTLECESLHALSLSLSLSLSVGYVKVKPDDVDAGSSVSMKCHKKYLL